MYLSKSSLLSWYSRLPLSSASVQLEKDVLADRKKICSGQYISSRCYAALMRSNSTLIRLSVVDHGPGSRFKRLTFQQTDRQPDKQGLDEPLYRTACCSSSRLVLCFCVICHLDLERRQPTTTTATTRRQSVTQSTTISMRSTSPTKLSYRVSSKDLMARRQNALWPSYETRGCPCFWQQSRCHTRQLIKAGAAHGLRQ